MSGADTDHGEDRPLVGGVAGFVVVHLLALVVLGELSLPTLAGVEGLAVAVLVGGDLVTTRDVRATALVVVAAVVGVVAVGLALGAAEPWVVAVGLLAVGGSLLYAFQWYDRAVAGGVVA